MNEIISFLQARLSRFNDQLLANENYLENQYSKIEETKREMSLQRLQIADHERAIAQLISIQAAEPVCEHLFTNVVSLNKNA